MQRNLERWKMRLRTSYITPTLYNKLFGVMQWDNVLAMRTALETGLRISDVLQLKVTNLNGRTVSGVAQKTGKPYRKVISQELANRLKRNEVNGYLFIGRFGNKPRTRQAVYKDIKKAARIIGIRANVAPHSARKTYAVERLADEGLKATQDELQHDKIETTMLYAFSNLLEDKGDGQGASPGRVPCPECEDWKELADYLLERLEQMFRLYEWRRRDYTKN